MKLPEISITNANTWRTPPEELSSRPRFVSRYELECYLTDTGETCIDGEWHELLRGSVTFTRPGQIRHSRFPFETRFIYFETDEPHGEFDSLLSRLPYWIPSAPRFEEDFSRIIECFRKSELRAAARLIELLFSLGEQSFAPPERRLLVGQSEIFAAIRFMKANLTRRVSVSEMAFAAGYSTPHFNELFRELTGTTPYSYFLGLRLKEAKRLLVGGMSVGEVAERLDFGSTSHFCSVFRRNIGVTPSEFVRQGLLTEYEIN